MAKEPGPSAARIAAILRSQDGVLKTDPLDVAHRIVSQQRASIERGPALLAGNGNFVTMPLGISLDAKVNQIAERTSLLLADLQRQCEGDKFDMERQLDQIGSRTDNRISLLEARIASCEEQQNKMLDRHESDAWTLNEARSLVSAAVGELQAQWRAHQSEFRGEQEEARNRVDELARCVQQSSHRLEDLTHAVEEQDAAIRHAEEQVNQPPWYGQIEAALAALDHRLEEHRSASEAFTCRFRMDIDAFKHRMDSLQAFREDILQTVDMRLDQEVDRLTGSKGSEQMRQEVHASSSKAAPELSRRIDDTEARVAALRVRVDAHDTRFTSLGERAETVCQQAVESARQAALQQREDILSEADCQVRILRQRVDALTELYDEMSLREVPASSHPRRGGSPHGPPRSRAEEAEPDRRGRPPLPRPDF